MSRALLVVLPFAAACVGNIQRSARVPHPAVPLQSGQPLAAPVELSGGLSNVTDVVAPRVGDPTQAVEVPSTQMRDELRFKLRDRAQLGLIYERGFGATSKMPDSTQAPVGPGDVAGYGMSFGYSFETGTPGFAVGTTVELMGWTVPYVEYTTCTNCVGNITIVDHGTANPMTLGIGIQPSYKSGAITLFGGVFARNHPTTLRKEMNTDVTFSDNGDVQGGPFNAIANVGIELELAKQVSALVLVHQDLVSDPVRYGPGIGVALSGRIGE